MKKTKYSQNFNKGKVTFMTGITDFKVAGQRLLMKMEGFDQDATHSVRLGENNITWSYWDSLAWSIYQTGPRHWLLLGLGGGTVLQLLQRWGFTPPCLAIELNREITADLKHAGWFTYPNLEIIHQDARDYVASCKSHFDAIIVDVYDDKGYVNELYRLPGLKHLLSCLSDRGTLVLHCLDPMMKFRSLGSLISPPPESATLRIMEEILQLGLQTCIYPSWTSAMIVASSKSLDSNGSIRWAQKLLGVETANPLRWLNAHLRSRLMTPVCFRQDLRSGITCGTFQELYAEEARCKNNLIEVLTHHPLWIQPEQQAYLNAGLQLTAILQDVSLDSTKELEAAHTLQKIMESSPTSEVRQIVSFLLARLGKWEEAVEVLFS
ncbi:hypothetical protein HY230_10855 [Candidatus Acetothermia bacterium]|nr:hypothetical protein [Candidatus Acetothermia bacterium]